MSVGTGGGTPNLLVRCADAEQLTACVQGESAGFSVRLELDAGLPVGAQIVLALELPDHPFIQGVGTVHATRDRHCHIKAQAANPSDLTLLRRALDVSASGTSRRKT
jgi:hypothetical protein